MHQAKQLYPSIHRQNLLKFDITHHAACDALITLQCHRPHNVKKLEDLTKHNPRPKHSNIYIEREREREVVCPNWIHSRNRTTRHKSSIIIQLLRYFDYLNSSELVDFDSLHHGGPNCFHTQLQAPHSLDVPFARCKSCEIGCEDTGAYHASHFDATCDHRLHRHTQVACPVAGKCKRKSTLKINPTIIAD